jgi:hypothetical protein
MKTQTLFIKFDAAYLIFACLVSLQGAVVAKQLCFLEPLNADFKITTIGNTVSQTPWRDYHTEVTPIEKEFISFIVSTLGNKSLTKVWKEKSSLKKAGDQIDHIHPLKFLTIIFTDENLKVAIANLKESKWVWTESKKGLFSSLSDELASENMPLEYIQEFSETIGIDPALILPSIYHADWDDFFSVLIKNVPREGNPGRYDM